MGRSRQANQGNQVRVIKCVSIEKKNARIDLAQTEHKFESNPDGWKAYKINRQSGNRSRDLEVVIGILIDAVLGFK